MVRETRHLWIGNLPHTIREDRILDHFKRYGKVQSVKILPKKEDEGGGGGGACATVAFIDIKSAAKAHNADNKIEERTLKTDYYEPPASSTASSAIFIHERDDALVARNAAPPSAPYANPRNVRYGLPEDRNYERPTPHYYERVGERELYLRRPIGMGYHDEEAYSGRAKSRDRYVSRSTTGGNYTEGADRNPNHFRPHNARQLFEPARYSEQYTDDGHVANATARRNRTTNSGNSNNNNNGPTSSVASSAVSSSSSSSPPPASESRSRRSATSNSSSVNATTNKRRSPSQSPSGSRSVSRSRSRSSSGSRSSSSSSKLRSSSNDSSGRSRSPSKSRSPVASYGSQSNAKRLDRPANALMNVASLTSSYLPSVSSNPGVNCSPVVNLQTCLSQSNASSSSSLATSNDGLVDKEEKRPLGICVRNLPVRSTDTSLKDGLFHEYKKHGKVTIVKVIGQGTERYAVVCFKKPEDVDKALEVSKDKLFFGCKIEVTAHEGLDADDNEYRPLEAELDEYHPKATRTLFIGNLEKDITTAELRKHFEQFGEIIEIDIKKQGSATSYAFIQYADIASVVKAMRKLDGENLGANRIKLGFGKSMPTNCVWLDGIVDAVSEKYLGRHFSRFGLVACCAVDREKNHALIFYDSVDCAQIAVAEMRGRILSGKKLQVDFASRECQTSFFDKLEMTGQLVPGDRPWERRDRRTNEFENARTDERDARVGFENRVYARYEGQARTNNRGNFRGIQRTGFCGRGRGQNFPSRYEIFHDEFGERRHRYNSRDESGNETTTFDANKVDRLKYNTSDPLDCNNRKRNKLRNSISDQESHHSISPPRSRHESRSTSPVSKERVTNSTTSNKSNLKDRLHHRIKSPGSHNSSQVSSPCRESANEDPADTEFRTKGIDGKLDTSGDCDVIGPPVSSPKHFALHDGLEKCYKTDSDSTRRRSIDSSSSENIDENCSLATEQLSQLERKKRLLAASSLSDKDGSVLVTKMFKLKSTAIHSITNKLNCVLDSSLSEEKCSTETGGGDATKEKTVDSIVTTAISATPVTTTTTTTTTESANTDLKYLQKKQVHLLHLLEQLHEGVNSSDTEGSLDSERFSRKKCSLSTCVENVYSNETDVTKAVTKDECNARLLKCALKEQQQHVAKGLSKTDSIDSNNCYSNSLDSFVFRKHLDPRKMTEQYNSQNSLPKCRKVPTEGEAAQGSGNSSDVYLKKQQCESSTADDEDGKRSSSSDGKRERDISPLSLPLPKFAASLRSPKSSPSVITSPKSFALSPRAVHSPNPHSSSKCTKVTSSLLDSHGDKRTDEKLNGLNISPSASSPNQSDDATFLESIQSPKNHLTRVKEVTISSDSDLSPISSPNRPSIEDRIKALDEKFNVWSGSTRTTGNAPPDTSPTAVVEIPKSNIKKRSRFNYLTPDLKAEPSDIVKSLLSKSTIFDQDSMRLQHIDEKYEPVSVKMDLSPKIKPTFRTKAAAKEFSSPVSTSLPTFIPTMHAKAPPTAVGSISSPPENSAMTNSVLSPITPPTPHFTQGPSQLYTPCSPCVASFPSCREAGENAVITSNDLPGDQAGLTPKTYVLKTKTEPGVEVMTHSIVAMSLPVSVKKEALCLKDNFQMTIKEVDKVCKKEAVIPSPLKNLLHHKNSDSYSDHSTKRELNERHPSSLKDFWKNSESIDETNNIVVKMLPNSDATDTNLSTSNPVKKRVSSVDSSESESGKSYKSTELFRENHHDMLWMRHDKDKNDSKIQEPECKKSKLSLPRNRSPTPVSSYKKSERKSKTEKSSRSSNSKKIQSDKDETDIKHMKESREKSKLDNHKSRDDKKSSKVRDHKDGSLKNEQRTKSFERKHGQSYPDNKENKSSSLSKDKSKKEHSSSRSEKSGKSEKKTDKKSSSKSKLKHDMDFAFEEEPVYFSMYDKVKARSSKQQTMKHQAKDLETMRQKFSKLKQSRAKREEKSKSIDSDKDSDSAMSQLSSDSEARTSKSKQQRKRKLVIESSSEDDHPQRESQNRRNDKKDLSDSPSDSDYDQKMHHKQLNSKNRKKKTDVIESDSSDSNSHMPLQKMPQSSLKKKSKPRSGTQEKTKKLVKSDDECSDIDMADKSVSKDKEHRRKKPKKATKSSHDIKMDRDNLTLPHKKSLEDINKVKKKSHKDDRQHSESSILSTKHEELLDNASRERKPENEIESMDVEESDKYKSFSRKKKKAKKTSRSKEKRVSTTDRRSSEFTSRRDDESESKSSLPVLLSPRPNSPIDDKPLSPPCLRAGDASDNDIKSDFSEEEFELQQRKDSDSDRNRMDIKVETVGESKVSTSNSTIRKKESTFSPTKISHSAEFFDSDHSLVTFPEKLICKPSQHKEHSSKSNHHSLENSTNKKKIPQSTSSSSSVRKTKDLLNENFHYKEKQEKTNEESFSFNKHSDNKLFDRNYSKNDKRSRKKIKKPVKEKKWKPTKMDEVKEVDNRLRDANISSMRSASPLIFESVSLDNDSRLSDVRIDEEIATEARRLEQELLAASEETSTFGDDSPIVKKEEKLAERKFEEEAAKETKRLEAELFSTGRESWHMKEKSFGPEELISEELCNEDKNLCDSIMKEENLFASLALHSSTLDDTPQHENDIFLTAHSEEEDKDCVNEIDDQRKIEDDLAVSALLQEMNSGDISAPELTKETDYLEPLLATQPDTMNYLLPDDGEDSLHIVDESPELLVNENSNVGMDTEDIPLSPSSNSEPPPLEISNFEESYNAKPVQEEVTKSDLSDTFIPIKSVVEHIECSPLVKTDNKPPVIDIPNRTVSFNSTSISPRSDKKFQKKRWEDRSSRFSLVSSEDTNFSEHSERNSEEFEDITMDTKDSKDDDNPPVLLPVDLPPRLETDAVKTKVVLPNIPVTNTDSVIVKAPDTSQPLEHPKKEQKVPPINLLTNFEDSCENMTPITSNPPFCPSVNETAPIFKLSEISKSSSEIDRYPQVTIETTSVAATTTLASIVPESTVCWSDPVLTSASTTQKDLLNKLPTEPQRTKTPVLYYPDLFRSTDTADEIKKCDTSVIKSTAGLNLLSPEPQRKDTIDSEHRPPSNGNFLQNVFSPNRDTRGVVIFNTSQLAKTRESTTLPHRENISMQHIFNYDQKFNTPSVIGKIVSDKEKPVESASNKVKDPFDALQETPKPPSLHFPPLFTIPTTEPVLPSKEKEETAVANNDVEKDDVKVELLPPTLVVTTTLSNHTINSEVVNTDQIRPEHEDDVETTSSLAETLSKINEKLEGDDNFDKKSKSADVESVSSDTTDIAFPDVKSELEINQLAEEQVRDGGMSVSEEAEVPDKSERPRRGRRPRTRKAADATVDTAPTPTPIKGKRTRATAVERNRRSLRSDTLEQLTISDNKESVIENKIKTPVFCESEDDTKKSVEEIQKIDHPTGNVETSLSTIEHETNPRVEIEPIKHSDRTYHTRSEKSRKKRGRKKKSSGDDQISNAMEKVEDTDHSNKDSHRLKHSRFRLPVATEKERTPKKDVYEFSDSEDDKPDSDAIMERKKETSPFHEKIKPEPKPVEFPPEKTEEPKPHKLPVIEDTQSFAKEYVTEVDLCKKISLKIRLKKSGQDGTSTGTAEFVKPPEILPIEETKMETLKPDKVAHKEAPQSVTSHNGPSKCTRKSTRLMNQASKSSVVVEEITKVTSEVTSRVTRRSRANRKSEENVSSDTFEDPTEDKNKNEPMFVIPDNTVKDIPDLKKSPVNQAISTNEPASIISDSDKSCHEPEKNDHVASLRLFRFTSKLITQKENSGSETTFEDSQKKDNSNSSPSDDEKKETSQKEVPLETSSLPVLKVELTKIAKEQLPQKNEKTINAEEDSDSRSSPTMLVDPITGVLTPVGKKASSIITPVSVIDTKSSIVTSTVSTTISQPSSTLTTVPLDAKPISEETNINKDEKMAAVKPWDNIRAPMMADTFAAQAPPLVKRTSSSSDVQDIQVLDLKAGSGSHKPKTCIPVGVVTSVVSSASPLPLNTKVPTIPLTTSYPVSTSGPTLFVRSQANIAAMKLPLESMALESHLQPLKPGLVATIASESPIANLPLKVQTKHNPIASTDLNLAMATKVEAPPAHTNVSSLQPANLKNDVPEAAHNWTSKDIATPPTASTSTTWPSSKHVPMANQGPPNSADMPSHLGAVAAHHTKAESRVTQPPHSHSSKSSAAYLQQAGFPAAIFDTAQPNIQSLAANNSGGVIAELLQNPQFLQKHKEFLAAAASSSQFQDRNTSQLVRPSTPVTAGMPPDVASRLGNPTPPHTPTPLNNSPDVHNPHVAASMHLRQPPYPALGLSSWDPYSHPQIMFAQHYVAAMHQDLRTHDAQARAVMGRFAYPSIPSSAGNFRQPLDPRLPHSAFIEHKADGKDLVDPTHEKANMKPMRSKKKDDKDNHERPGSGHDKHPPNAAALRQQHVHYPSTIRQLSPHERTTDSPVVANLYTPGGRIPISEQLKELKADANLALHPSLFMKGDPVDRTLNPPAAHQSRVSTLPYHTLDGSTHPAVRQQLLRVGSPAPGYVDGRTSAQPAPSASTYGYKKEHHIPPSDKEVIVRSIGHQDSSVSPSLVNSQVIPAHGRNMPPHPMMAQNDPRASHPMADVLPIPDPSDIVENHPVMWQGLLALKNDHATVQMHFVSGNKIIATKALPSTTLRIAQRMKLEQAQLEGVHRKMQSQNEHCILMALPCGKDHLDVLEQSSKLKTGFIKYLLEKQAAGIVNAAAPDSPQPAYVIHIFPPSHFSEFSLKENAPQLANIISDITHLVIIIATV